MPARARVAANDDGLRRVRGASNFRQRDVSAAVRAVEAAGQKVHSVVFEPGGRFRVIVGGASGAVDEIEAAIAAHEAEHAR